MLYNIGGLLTMLATIALVVCVYTATDIRRKYAFLVALGFTEGATIGPLVQAIIDIDPSIITTAFAATSAVFACFSISAILAERRSMLFLGAMLSSAISMMVCATVRSVSDSSTDTTMPRL
jgi:Bax inhibitor 1